MCEISAVIAYITNVVALCKLARVKLHISLTSKGLTAPMAGPYKEQMSLPIKPRSSHIHNSRST